MKVGTEFTWHGAAIDDDGRIRLIAERRVKMANGSRLLGRRWGEESWPASPAGRRAAMARTLQLNEATRDSTAEIDQTARGPRAPRAKRPNRSTAS